MPKPIIAYYSFNEIKKNFRLIEGENHDCYDLPAYFNIKKCVQTPKFKADLLMKGRTVGFEPVLSGIRFLRENIQYGDLLNKRRTKKSFIILRYLDERNIELHFFDGFCPSDKWERSPYVTWYFKKSEIARPVFKKRPKKWDIDN